MRNPSTISREINRNISYVGNNCGYYPYTAQKEYRYRKRFSNRGLFVNNDDMLAYIESKLAISWSPEQISNYPSEFNMPSFKTIYR